MADKHKDDELKSSPPLMAWELGELQFVEYLRTRRAILQTRAAMGYQDAIEALRREQVDGR